MDIEGEAYVGPLSYCTRNRTEDASGFECNICLELAQDPIVTLCGHLYCWHCLYKWLHFHSQCQECPACKALIEMGTLVPLYGRGKATTHLDPRSLCIPHIGIPNRPTARRNVDYFPERVEEPMPIFRTLGRRRRIHASHFHRPPSQRSRLEPVNRGVSWSVLGLMYLVILCFGR